MITDKKWIAFFSHTGTEIYNISKRLNIVPDVIITNQAPGSKSINKKLLKLSTQFRYTNSKPRRSDYDRLLLDCNECISTLHGWMRIIPKSICKDYEMYNLHPGLITKYPELRGKDPQSRVSQEDHDLIGLVIHKVIPEVDEGEVIVEASCKNHYHGEKSITKKLHEMATDAWVDFFEHHIFE